MSAGKPSPWTTCVDRVTDDPPVSGLPADVQREAIKAYRMFQQNPSHPALRFKKLEGEPDVYSVRIGLGYRAAGVMKGSRIVWFWIGSHADFDHIG